jgi:hypothetical protein
VSSSHEAAREKGAALLIAILTTLLLAAMAASLVYVSTTETLISSAFRHGAEASNAADAALERALLDLDLLGSWSAAILPSPANVVSSFADGRTQFVAPDGRRFDLGQLTAQRQRESDATYGSQAFGADSPQWRLYAHAPLSEVLPPASVCQPAYLIVWVADDGWDADGNPSLDSNGRVLIHAEAYGGGGARRAVEASVGRARGGWLQVLTRRAVP